MQCLWAFQSEAVKSEVIIVFPSGPQQQHQTATNNAKPPVNRGFFRFWLFHNNKKHQRKPLKKLASWRADFSRKIAHSNR